MEIDLAIARRHDLLQSRHSDNQETSETTLFSELLNRHPLELRPAPEELTRHLSMGQEILTRVRDEVGSRTHGPYFDVSALRYSHYFAMASTLPKGALVLDIGNAPGHVGIGLWLMGFSVRGLNLNAAWRETYPSQIWLERFQVLECDIERSPLPFDADSFDAVIFTEVLEHIAVSHPLGIIQEIRRVLRPGGRLIFSTPNVCNVSNILALLKGQNIFWPGEIFYGSLDRHNREFTPEEVSTLLGKASFASVELFGINCASNWRGVGAEFATRLVAKLGETHGLLLNTTMALCTK